MSSRNLHFQGPFPKKILDFGRPVDATFVLSDLAAVHVIHARRSLGKKVSEDISVIGFDGVAVTGKYKFLTSIRQNVESVAEQSFAIMEKLLRKELVTGTITLVPPGLKEGTTLVPGR